MTKFNVGGSVVGSSFLGTVEAPSAESAIEKTWKRAGISLCHECSKEVSDLEIDSVWAENLETGEFTNSENLPPSVDEVLKALPILCHAVGFGRGKSPGWRNFFDAAGADTQPKCEILVQSGLFEHKGGGIYKATEKGLDLVKSFL